MVGLLWGAPVALAFGTVAAVVIVVLQTFLGALATWYGGWWDEVVQRAADVLLIIPLLPILLLIAIVYSPSIWYILLVLVAFGFVGTTTKVARSIVLQVKEEAYIEAAISYGASRSRILLKHILPRLMPGAKTVPPQKGGPGRYRPGPPTLVVSVSWSRSGPV